MLVEPLFAHAASMPDDVAVTDEQGPRTYRQLAAAAAGLAMYLQMQTDKQNVGLFLPAGALFVASFYATLLAGKSVVPINFLLGEREVAHVIADSGIDTVLTVTPLAGRLEKTGLNVIDLALLPHPEPDVEVPKPVIPPKSADDLAVVMYTSGTSGLPKGVMLTYGNLQSDVDASIEHAALQKRHKFLGVIPLFHAFGMTAMMLAPVQLGAPVIYMARFNPSAAVAAIRDQGVSIVFAVPSMFNAMLNVKSAKAEDFKSVYALISGGEPLPAKLREGFLEKLGQPILEGFGLTETSPVISLNTPQANRVGSVGKPLPGVTVKIVDDDGNAVPPGGSGEVWLRGPMIMKGYYHLPEATADALTPDRFFKTGDLGKFEDGYLYITGRKKDLIIVAGEKAVPREIEEVLARHHSVADVAVVGKKDPGRGEVVVAFVVPRDGQAIDDNALRAFCKEHGLPGWKVPKAFFAEKELPRSPTGKILKRALAEKANAQPTEA